MPGILAKEKELSLPPRAGDRRYIAANLGRSVQQKGCEVVAPACLGAGDGGRAGAEAEKSPWAEALALNQVIAQSPDVRAPFEGVIVMDFGPGAHHVDVGFAAVPRL